MAVIGLACGEEKTGSSRSPNQLAGTWFGNEIDTPFVDEFVTPITPLKMTIDDKSRITSVNDDPSVTGVITFSEDDFDIGRIYAFELDDGSRQGHFFVEQKWTYAAIVEDLGGTSGKFAVLERELDAIGSFSNDDLAAKKSANGFIVTTDSNFKVVSVSNYLLKTDPITPGSLEPIPFSEGIPIFNPIIGSYTTFFSGGVWSGAYTDFGEFSFPGKPILAMMIGSDLFKGFAAQYECDPLVTWPACDFFVFRVTED